MADKTEISIRLIYKWLEENVINFTMEKKCEIMQAIKDYNVGISAIPNPIICAEYGGIVSKIEFSLAPFLIDENRVHEILCSPVM